jgi:hypothetical protein
MPRVRLGRDLGVFNWKRDWKMIILLLSLLISITVVAFIPVVLLAIL